MEQIDKKDIQGIITKGYSKLPSACFVLLKISDSILFKKWLSANLLFVTHGSSESNSKAFNIAFTYEGLRILGLTKASLDTFPLAFEDGMTTRHKQELLGDFGKSDPANWAWGQKGSSDTHLVLMIYASNQITLDEFYNTLKGDNYGSSMKELVFLDTAQLSQRKEHFGFHDGIAQPTINGLGRPDHPNNTVAAGEFILGYKNEYNQYEYSPGIEATADINNLLCPSQHIEGMKDIGKNGTYLVFRQLEQDVQGFWQYMKNKTANNDSTLNPNEMIKLASKIVGRWPNGDPITLNSEQEDKKLADTDYFGYRSHDGDGMKCPFGSHIRRTNPRDSIDTDRITSIKIANKHRIIRRGRSYGDPVAESMNPLDIIHAENKSGTRGLHFLCINTNLTMQFEFIQNSWVNNPKFAGLYDERDPLIGNHSDPRELKHTGTFSVSENPMRKRYTDLPEFVTTKGGAYFFLPGMTALQVLTSI